MRFTLYFVLLISCIFGFVVLVVIWFPSNITGFTFLENEIIYGQNWWADHTNGAQHLSIHYFVSVANTFCANFAVSS